MVSEKKRFRKHQTECWFEPQTKIWTIVLVSWWFLSLEASALHDLDIYLRRYSFCYREFSGTPPLKWYENRFTIRCSRLCIIHTRFEVRCVPVILENVLHHQNVSVRHMKNFLRASKVKFFAKTYTKWQNILKVGRAFLETWILKIEAKVTFPSIKNVSLVARSWFEVRCIFLM